MRNSDWDLDLRDGKQGENLVADLLRIQTVEVKTDRRWHETGNIYIETHCASQKGDWYPSGVNTSKATHYAFVLNGAALIVEKDVLIQVVRQYGRKIKCDIPPNPSRGYLITPENLLAYVRQKSSSSSS